MEFNKLYTKGPWKVEGPISNADLGPSYDISNIYEVSGGHKKIWTALCQDKANAELVRLAPEMLEELKAIASDIREWRETNDQDIPYRVIGYLVSIKRLLDTRVDEDGST